MRLSKSLKILLFLMLYVSFGFKALALERQDSLKTIIGGTNKVYFQGSSKKLEPTYRNNLKTLTTLIDTAFTFSDTTGVDSLSNTNATPFIGVKANLLYWAGLSPEPNYRGFMPNLALEAYFGNRYSVHLEGVYTKLDKKNADKEIWAVSGITLEPRFWLSNDSKYTGLYAGLFGQYGDFDVKLNTISKTQGYTGTFFAAGLSLGYHYAISNAFGLEAGLGVGYRQAKTNQYIFRETNHHYYLEHAATESTFGLQQLRLSVAYRFSK